jgi:AcrR family transcriptional regulator
MRYFGGKAGLLAAIFNESWAPLNDEIQRLIANAPHAGEAVLGVLAAVTRAFGAGPELAVLFLFEGRRIRGSSKVVLSKGFVEFNDLIRALIRRGQQDGSFRPDFSDGALAAALMGAAEGMMRERLVSERAGKRPFAEREVRRVFAALLTGVVVAPAPPG